MIQRRGIRAKKNILKGEMIKETDLAYLRPCTDECLPPYKKNLVIGKKTSTNVVEGDPINLSNVE